MGLAFDAARGDVVMFGGSSTGPPRNDTRTWDGTSWTEQHPATVPPARDSMGMVYDAAAGRIVLFGGRASGGIPYGDTWTWDGTNWTEEAPAHAPSERYAMATAYDAARQEAVVFGGYGRGGRATYLDDTWTWDGADWTKQHPARSPIAREYMSMAYDASDADTVFFGGSACDGCYVDDTWIWDGATWTERSPHVRPSARCCNGIAYDAARADIVLFGGYDGDGNAYLGDTWVWNGAAWSIPFVAHVHVGPDAGPAGTRIRLRAVHFGARERVTAIFIDSVKGQIPLGTFRADPRGRLHVRATIPSNATPGAQKVRVTGVLSGQQATTTFTIT
jgi:hypothetical protein